MSLARFAMRVAAARALRGATLAEDRVFDSAVDPIDMKIAEARAPMLIVTTDEHEVTPTGRDLIGGDISCDLVIEAAIASRVEVDGQMAMTIPHTDEGMEFVLDIMEHQVVAGLTRERTDWSRVWMRLVPRVKKRLSRRGASTENGVRFAARQIVLTCDLIEAPTDGASIQSSSAWSDVIAVMGADENLAPLAQLLRSTIEGTPLAEWQRAANMLGILSEEANSIGIVPILDEAGNPVQFSGVTMTGDISATLDSQAATDQGFPNGNP